MFDYYRAFNDTEFRVIYEGNKMGFNQQIRDFGLRMSLIGDKDIVAERIQFINKRFKLVMINERLDESLVLLAHHLCLPLHLMATLKLNARIDKYVVRMLLHLSHHLKCGFLFSFIKISIKKEMHFRFANIDNASSSLF